MQIAVAMPGDVREWGLVELQGQLETRDQVPLDGMHIGDLHFTSKGLPSLIVGHHVLAGKVVALDKPYAVLRKKRQRRELDSADSADEGMEVDLTDGDHTEGSCREYEVVALITKKIIFKNRPKPIVTKTVKR